MRFLPRTILTASVILIAGFAARPASADPLWQITGIDHGTTAGFGYTMWHAASSGTGTNGDKLARMSLDPNKESMLDPAASTLEIHAILFDGTSLSGGGQPSGTEIGTVAGKSTDINVSQLADGNAMPLVDFTIEWVFRFIAKPDPDKSKLEKQLLTRYAPDANGDIRVTLSYFDRGYAGESGGIFANSLVEPTQATAGILTLWGADNPNAEGQFPDSVIGSDIVAYLQIQRTLVPPQPQRTPVPEPTSIAIWSLFGLLAVVIGCRRRRRCHLSSY
jgi:hypothetical protein